MEPQMHCMFGKKTLYQDNCLILGYYLCFSRAYSTEKQTNVALICAHICFLFLRRALCLTYGSINPFSQS